MGGHPCHGGTPLPYFPQRPAYTHKPAYAGTAVEGLLPCAQPCCDSLGAQWQLNTTNEAEELVQEDTQEWGMGGGEGEG